MDAIAQTYKEILARLRVKAPNIDFIDLYRGQYDKEKSEEELPNHETAALFAWGKIPFESLGKRTQHASGDFVMYVAAHTFKESSNKEGPADFDASLAHMEHIGEVSRALHGFRGTTFDNVKRIGVRAYVSDKTVIVHSVHFAIRVFDDLTTNYVDADPNPSVNIKH